MDGEGGGPAFNSDDKDSGYKEAAEAEAEKQKRPGVEGVDYPFQPPPYLSYDRHVVPTVMQGTVMGRTAHQIFASTAPALLPLGMCGGPVIMDRDPSTLSWRANSSSGSSKSAAISGASSTSSASSASASTSTGNSNFSSAAATSSTFSPNAASTSAVSATAVATTASTATADNVTTTTTTATTTATATTATASTGGKKRRGVSIKESQAGPSAIDPTTGELRVNKQVIVAGLLEGIVPVEYPVEELRGAAVFVEGPTIFR